MTAVSAHVRPRKVSIVTHFFRRWPITSAAAKALNLGAPATDGAPQWRRGCVEQPLGTISSAIWKVMDRPWRTILAPIFTSVSRSVVIACNCSRTALALKPWQDSRVRMTALSRPLMCCSTVPRWGGCAHIATKRR